MFSISDKINVYVLVLAISVILSCLTDHEFGINAQPLAQNEGTRLLSPYTLGHLFFCGYTYNLLLRARFPLRLSAAVLFSELRAFPSCVLLLLNVHSLFSFMWKQLLEIFASSPKFKATFTMNVSWNFSFFTLFHHRVLDVDPWSPSFFFSSIILKGIRFESEKPGKYPFLCLSVQSEGILIVLFVYCMFPQELQKVRIIGKKKNYIWFRIKISSWSPLDLNVIWVHVISHCTDGRVDRYDYFRGIFTYNNGPPIFFFLCMLLVLIIEVQCKWSILILRIKKRSKANNMSINLCYSFCSFWLVVVFIIDIAIYKRFYSNSKCKHDCIIIRWKEKGRESGKKKLPLHN